MHFPTRGSFMGEWLFPFSSPFYPKGLTRGLEQSKNSGRLTALKECSPSLQHRTRVVLCFKQSIPGSKVMGTRALHSLSPPSGHRALLLVPPLEHSVFCSGLSWLFGVVSGPEELPGCQLLHLGNHGVQNRKKWALSRHQGETIEK